MGRAPNQRRTNRHTHHSRLARLLPFTFPVAAVPFASVHEIPLIVAGTSLTCLTAAALWRTTTARKLQTQTAILFVIAALPIFLGLITIWPVSPGIRAWFQPGYEPLVRASIGASSSEFRPMSLNPHQSLVEYCFDIGMLSLAFLSALVLSSPHRAKRGTRVLLVSAAALAALGIIQRYTGGDSILWLFL